MAIIIITMIIIIMFYKVVFKTVLVDVDMTDCVVGEGDPANIVSPVSPVCHSPM